MRDDAETARLQGRWPTIAFTPIGSDWDRAYPLHPSPAERAARARVFDAMRHAVKAQAARLWDLPKE